MFQNLSLDGLSVPLHAERCRAEGGTQRPGKPSSPSPRRKQLHPAREQRLPSSGLFPSLQVILAQAPSAANSQHCLPSAVLLPQSHLPPLLASAAYAPPCSCLADVFITSIRSCHRFASSPSIALHHIYSKLFIEVPAPSRPLLWPSGCFPTRSLHLGLRSPSPVSLSNATCFLTSASRAHCTWNATSSAFHLVSSSPASGKVSPSKRLTLTASV